jgi:two-component system phosphate regulon sensor histidine kinase PhoR
MRLVLGYGLVAVIFAAAWLWSLYGPLTSAALKQQQRNLTAVAQAGALVAKESNSTAPEIAKRLVARTDLRVTIVAASGTVLADSHNDPAKMENHANRPEIKAALAGRVGTARRVSKTEGIEQLYVAVPASIGSQRVALRVSQPLNEIRAIGARSRQVGLMLMVAALAIALFVANKATAAAARPIDALSATAKRMAAGDLDAEVPEVPADLGDLAGALVVLRTQMRSRIEALDTERRTLRTTLDGLTDAVFLVENGSVRIANNAASEMFGTPTSGWRGVVLDEDVMPASLAGAIRSKIERGAAFSAELEPDPAGRVLRLVVVPLTSAENRGRVLVSVSDVTERATLDRIRRDFVANASHELKTPVAGIQLLASSAKTAAQDGDEPQAVAFAVQIEAEADRLRHLVGDLLDLSRLESSGLPDEIADVRQAIDLAITGHHSAATRKELALEVDLTPIRGIDVFVSVDPTDLAVALDNLIDNAIAYTEKGSVTTHVSVDDDEVRIDISDTGAGIAPEHLGRIFERFYRVDKARSRYSGGTGLGLSLVRHVLERSGGTVSVESQLGVGSTFTLVLPRAR